MSRLKTLRTIIFGMDKQAPFARAIGVSQQTYSFAERKDRMPSWYMDRIRRLANERGIEWNDTWFFEPPQGDRVSITETPVSADPPRTGSGQAG